MPAECLVLECRKCDWHVVRGQKLECNFKNRLGLSKPTMGEFAGGLSDEQVKTKQKEALGAEIGRLKALLGEGEESGK